MVVVSACRTDDIYNQARFTDRQLTPTQCMDLLQTQLHVTVPKPEHASTVRDQILLYGSLNMAVICHTGIA